MITSTVSSLILIKSLISHPFSHSLTKCLHEQDGQDLHRVGVEVIHLKDDCACARAREGQYSCSPSPALPEGIVESVGWGVGKNDVVSFMLEATLMTDDNDDIDCPYWPQSATLTQPIHQPWPSLLKGPIISQSYATFLHSYWPYFHIFLFHSIIMFTILIRL